MSSCQMFILGLCEHLAWPLMIGISVFYFRKDIKKIFPRLTKLPGGAELNPETVEEQKENKNTYDALVAKKAEGKAKQEEQENKQ